MLWVCWADSSLVPFLFCQKHFCVITHLPQQGKEQNLKTRENSLTYTHRWKTHAAMCTPSLTKVLLLFYLPYSTCFRQSAPTRLKWILSRPFRFSVGDVLMKGDGTIWTDQVAASSAQLRAKDGDTPLYETKDKSTVHWYTHYPSH